MEEQTNYIWYILFNLGVIFRISSLSLYLSLLLAFQPFGNCISDSAKWTFLHYIFNFNLRAESLF